MPIAPFLGGYDAKQEKDARSKSQAQQTNSSLCRPDRSGRSSHTQHDDGGMSANPQSAARTNEFGTVFLQTPQARWIADPPRYAAGLVSPRSQSVTFSRADLWHRRVGVPLSVGGRGRSGSSLRLLLLHLGSTERGTRDLPRGLRRLSAFRCLRRLRTNRRTVARRLESQLLGPRPPQV